MTNFYMSRGASKVINTCVKVKEGEQVLLITELSHLSIAQALASEVYRVGAEPALCIMEPRKRDGGTAKGYCGCDESQRCLLLDRWKIDHAHTGSKDSAFGRRQGIGTDWFYRRDDDERRY